MPTFEQGYDIDRAYAEADRHLTGSDAWHYWMDEASRLEKLHRRPCHWEKMSGVCMVCGAGPDEECEIEREQRRARRARP